MFKTLENTVWAFDVEWVPDPKAGKAIYNLDDNLSDREVINIMWEKGGADEKNPMPYLKTVMCKVVSLSMVSRRITQNGIEVKLHSLPSIPTEGKKCSEKYILKTFLDAVGKSKPQLVGYNSISADLRILVQRSIAKGIEAGSYAKRPNKPWEDRDYFSSNNNWNVDLMRILGGWGKSTPSLHEMAVASGIPGKMGVDGQEVAPLWLEGKLDDIVAYNECDALTTYLLWLRLAHFAGFFSEKEYEDEQILVKEVIEIELEKNNREHLKKYLSEWYRLKNYV